MASILSGAIIAGTVAGTLGTGLGGASLLPLWGGRGGADYSVFFAFLFRRGHAIRNLPRPAA